ncbi:hypothetical protein [Streptomyces sp. HB132]|uniref:hypothetical protein n=1 Tax=Streptomyces sp. HB132 TaxID=767388 RepID=UPI00195F9200|nr:hypothetical protein [Streptomyces sp. HB132]MBM7441863.1 hypothetical protein [Streptomyces sp. HB132]
MHGYGYPPEQQRPTRRPSSSTLVTLRVVFVALTLLSCGFLAWAAMLRLAIVTRKQRDWWLFGLVLALNAGLVAYLGSLPPEEETMTDGQAIIMLSWMLVVFVGTVTYYLYTEIRHFGPYGVPQGSSYAGPYAGPYAGQHPAAFPSPGYASGRTATPAPPSYGYPPAPQRSPAATPPPSSAPGPATPAAPAAPQRLDQVRAELDELSDYLRKEGDSR